jgi:hypothetical protein
MSRFEKLGFLASRPIPSSIANEYRMRPSCLYAPDDLARDHSLTPPILYPVHLRLTFLCMSDRSIGRNLPGKLIYSNARVKSALALKVVWQRCSDVKIEYDSSWICPMRFDCAYFRFVSIGLTSRCA